MPVGASKADVSGQRFGYLVATSRCAPPKNQGGAHWLCRCDCGAVTIANPHQLLSGKKRSCGCRKRELLRKASLKHGGFGTPEYAIWNNMRDRCQNPNSSNFADWGGRGITVCERWQSFENFYADMGARPSPRHSIDRIDNDGPYTSENCRWATQSQQSRNTRRTALITFNERTQARDDWAEETGLPGPTIQRRLDRGWSVEKALTTPLQPGGRPRRG